MEWPSADGVALDDIDAVVDRLKKRVETLRSQLPPGWKMDLVRDQSEYILAAVHAVQEHLILGSILAAGIVWLFLGKIRPTIIAAVAIPSALIATFAAEARFPGIRLDTEWPQDAIPRIGLDPYTAVVALAHVGHIDDEALKLAMRSDCFYIGALGSRRNNAKRAERLAAAGFSKEEIARIHAPIGINIGAQSPQEIAISIMAELVLALRGPRTFRPA